MSDIEVLELKFAAEESSADRRHSAPRAQGLRHLGAIIGTVSLHISPIVAVHLGAHSQKAFARHVQSLESYAQSEVSPAEPLVFIGLVAPRSPSPDLSVAASLNNHAPTVKTEAISPPQFLRFDVENAPAAASEIASDNAGNEAEKRLLYGRYTGQIYARIERAWQRPGSSTRPRIPAQATTSESGFPRDEPAFNCRVQIRQDVRGNVEEVLLLACSGTEEWRRSLIAAINQASPLPAPTTPDVFAPALTMTFGSD